MKNSVFFGKTGLTSTSANHIANLAKEYIRNLEAKLEGSHFYNIEIGLIGSSERNKTQNGVDASLLEELPGYLQSIAEAKSLIAWLREAIKAKEDLHDKLRDTTVEMYCEEKGIECPKRPTLDHILTKEEYYDSLPIKERNRYYSLETHAAVIGKYIHPDGILAERRNDLYVIVLAPHEVEGSGRDTLVYTYTPTVTPEQVESVFFELQRKHRAIQAELNGIQAACDEAIRESEIKAYQKYQAELDEYSTTSRTIGSKAREYISKKHKEVEKLKIVIPDKLRPVYEKISNLGK